MLVAVMSVAMMAAADAEIIAGASAQFQSRLRLSIDGHTLDSSFWLDS
jgi:hypothetical protein